MNETENTTNENENDGNATSWELREIAPAAGVVALIIWCFALWGPDDWSTSLSNAGQAAVGFVAGGIAVYAIVIALRQLGLQRVALNEQVKEQAVHAEQRHADAERMHMDKLADQYVGWFEKVLPILASMHDGIRDSWQLQPRVVALQMPVRR